MKLLSVIPQPLRLRLVAAAILAALGGLANTALLAVVNRSLSASTVALSHFVAAYALLLVVFSVTRLSSQRAGFGLSNQLLLSLRTRLSQQVADLDLRGLESIGRSRLVGALSDDVQTIGTGVAVLPLLLVAISMSVAAFGYIAWLSVKLMLLLLGSAVLGALVYARVRAYGHALASERLRRRNELLEGFDGLVSGATELRLHAARRNNFLEKGVRKPARQFRTLSFRADMSYLYGQHLGVTFFFITIAVVLFTPSQILALSVASKTGGVLAILFLIAPFENVATCLQALQRADIAVDGLKDLGVALDAARAPDSTASNTALPAAWDEIQLSGVEHSYIHESDGSEFKLGPIDLVIGRGQIVFIVGSNGSGKSTLAKVLSGLYTPETGKIQLGDTPITDENRAAYRELFSAIFGNFYVFSDLSLIGCDPSPQKVNALLAKLRLSHKVSVVDGKLSTLNLSTGQRKRLALLVAYLEDRPIYIFDEWASDQDPVFRNYFYKELLPELREAGKTVIAITHDDRYFSVADEVIKMDAGRVSEEDTSTFMWRLTK